MDGASAAGKFFILRSSFLIHKGKRSSFLIHKGKYKAFSAIDQK